MAMAVSADKLRTTLRNGAAATRGHPLLLLPPLILLISGAIIFVLMSFVTMTVPQHGSAGGTQTQVGLPGSAHSQDVGTAGGRSSRPSIPARRAWDRAPPPGRPAQRTA